MKYNSRVLMGLIIIGSGVCAFFHRIPTFSRLERPYTDRDKNGNIGPSQSERYKTAFLLPE